MYKKKGKASDLEGSIAELFFFVLANPVRIALLRGLSEGENITELTERLGRQRGGLQDHFVKLEEAGLICKTGERGKFFIITTLGNWVLRMRDALESRLLEIKEAFHQGNEEAERKIRMSRRYSETRGFGISTISEQEKATAVLAWEEADEKIKEILKGFAQDIQHLVK